MTQPTKADAPSAVYGCRNVYCAEQVSYPSYMLYWHGGCEDVVPGFYCDECWNNDDYLHDAESGVSLEEFLNKGES